MYILDLVLQTGHFTYKTLSVKLPKNARVKSIRSCIADEEIKYSVQDNMLMCTLRKLDVWDMIAVEMEVLRRILRIAYITFYAEVYLGFYPIQ